MPSSHITDHQVRLCMLFRQEHSLQAAAAKAGFSTVNRAGFTGSSES